MANSNIDLVWIQICYFVEFQRDDKGFWTRKFVEDDEENLTAILVPKSILYDELYKKVIEELKLDSMQFELEMRCENPIPSGYPEPPMKVDCDNRVRWFMAHIDRTKLSITLKKKACEIQEPCVVIDDNGRHVYGNDRESLESHRVEKSHNIAIDGNGRDDYNIGGESLESHRDEESLDRVIDDYDTNTNGINGKCLPRGVVAVDPLLSSLGKDAVLKAWQSSFNNRNDDILDNDKECMDASDDTNYEEDVREKTLIGDTFDDNGDGLNSIEAPLLQSIVRLDSIPSNPDSRHMTSWRIPESLDIKVNELFASKDHLIHKLEMMALKCHFEFLPQTSTRIIYVAHCAVEQCGWRVRAMKVNMSNPESSSTFQVRIYEGNHSCSPNVPKRYHRHASYKFLGRHYLQKFRDLSHVYTPKDIIRDFSNEFGYTIGYDKANKAKHFALKLINGSLEESNEKLPKTFIETDNEKRKGLGRKVLAPLADKNQSGVPSSTKRKKPPGERRGKKCSRCNKDEGHDSRTCSSLDASVPSMPALEVNPWP